MFVKLALLSKVKRLTFTLDLVLFNSLFAKAFRPQSFSYISKSRRNMADIVVANETFYDKKKIRSDLKLTLSTLTAEQIDIYSDSVLEKLRMVPEFQNSHCLSIYLAMPKEIQTYKLLKLALDMNKRVFIPKIIGGNPQDMIMIEVLSFEEIEKFPRNKWGIPEPPLEILQYRPDGVSSGVIDLVVLPGVAFDRSCGRVGHGKGYYDSFLERLENGNNVNNRSASTLKLAVAFDEQIIDAVPMCTHDRYLDFVVTPTEIYKRL
eukprot:gene11537-24132_t